MPDRLPICLEHAVAPGERGNEHEQRRFGEMEIRQQRVHDLEAMPRIEEDCRQPLSSCHVPAASDRRILQCTCGGRADGDHPPPVSLGPRDRFGGLRADVVGLRIDDVILDAADANRFESAVADVQRDFGPLDALALDRVTAGPA